MANHKLRIFANLIQFTPTGVKEAPIGLNWYFLPLVESDGRYFIDSDYPDHGETIEKLTNRILKFHNVYTFVSVNECKDFPYKYFIIKDSSEIEEIEESLVKGINNL